MAGPVLIGKFVEVTDKKEKKAKIALPDGEFTCTYSEFESAPRKNREVELLENISKSKTSFGNSRIKKVPNSYLVYEIDGSARNHLGYITLDRPVTISQQEPQTKPIDQSGFDFRTRYVLTLERIVVQDRTPEAILKVGSNGLRIKLPHPSPNMAGKMLTASPGKNDKNTFIVYATSSEGAGRGEIPVRKTYGVATMVIENGNS